MTRMVPPPPRGPDGRAHDADAAFLEEAGDGRVLRARVELDGADDNRLRGGVVTELDGLDAALLAHELAHGRQPGLLGLMALGLLLLITHMAIGGANRGRTYCRSAIADRSAWPHS